MTSRGDCPLRPVNWIPGERTVAECGVTIREHMALEVLKAIIGTGNVSIFENDDQVVAATVILTNRLLAALEAK